MKTFVPAVALSFLALASCTTGQERSAAPAPRETLSPEPSDAQVAHDPGILIIKRKLPEGPVFIEGSAAYARVMDASADVVLEGFFDVPAVPGGEANFPNRLEAELPPGEYRLTIYQRPCDPSACSGGDPETWGGRTLRCGTRLSLSPRQIFTATAVAQAGGCHIEQRSELGQLGG